MMKKAMVMAAGMGSRLEPLTLNTPKPLIKIANIPVMDILFNNLKKFGIESVIANTYYLSEQIIERYSNSNTSGINFSYIKEDELSGTAGGLKKCQYFFDCDEDFLVTSADGFFDIDLKKVFDSHKKSGAIATIVAKDIHIDDVSNFGVIGCDENSYVKEFQEKPKKEEAKSTLVNTGIYVFNYKIFNYIPPNTFFDFAKNVFPELMNDNQKINVYQTNEYWCDIGTIGQYIQTHKDIFNGVIKIDNTEIKNFYNSKLVQGNNMQVSMSTKFIGNNIIGSNCIFEDNVKIENSVIYDNVKIIKNSVIKNSIIAENSIIAGNIDHKIIEANSILEHTLEEV